MAKQEPKTMPIRLSMEAVEAVRIAAPIKGMTLSEYASAVLVEIANRDIDAYAKARAGSQHTKGSKS
jgi:hypothetical protein